MALGPLRVVSPWAPEISRPALDPSTKRTATLRSAHVQLGDVPRTHDPAEAEGEFHQHDGVVTVMIKLPTQGFT